jgi:hypothetical protein
MTVQMARKLRLLIPPVFFILFLAACGGSGGGDTDAPADISGTYVLIEDSDGSKPRAGATVTLVLDKGSLTLKAVMGRDELDDNGTYSIRDGRMTIEFREQGMGAKDAPFKYDGETLELPVKMFSDGEGSSTWRREGGQAAAQPTTRPAQQAKTHWNVWDLNRDVGASATKAFSDALEKGRTWDQALQDAADFARRQSNVSDVSLSDNGLSLAITYRDGREDYVITERLIFPQQGRGYFAAPAPEMFAFSGPGAPDLASLPSEASVVQQCGAITGASGSTSPAPEPGREGLHPAGGFGVTIYLADVQPKPLHANDSPPANARNALLLSPSYDLDHPMRYGDAVYVFNSIRSAVGNNIECIADDLKRAGYNVDTILGRLEGAKEVQAGDQATEELVKLLKTKQYGVIYFLSHGTYITKKAQSWLYMGVIDIERPEIKRAMNGRKLDPTVKEDMSKALAQILGLRWDDKDPVFVLGADLNGAPTLWLTPAFFSQLRAQGVSFANTLVFNNTCSSAANDSMADAFKAKAYFGWKIPVNGVFISKAAEEMFDLMADKARSARHAWWVWRRHEAWKIDHERSPREDASKPEEMRAIGLNNIDYAPITSQSIILIYRLRHGPASASSDIAQSMLFVRSCFEQIWSQGRTSGLAAPGCRPLEFGSHVPTREEVDDAIFEVGGPVQKPFGRWTMAD